MGQSELIKAILDLIVPILKNLLIFQMGKNSQKKIEEIKDLEQTNKKIKEENEIITKQNEVENKFHNTNSGDVYDIWLSERDTK